MMVRVLILVSVVGILSASVALAQTQKPPKYDPPPIDTFLGQLGLTEKQQAAVDKAREAMNTAMSKAKSPASTQTAQRTFASKVKNDILTSDQRKKLKDLQDQAYKDWKQQNSPPKKAK